ncbi:RNA splicing factor [Lithospermum erythrorhizon]|uniref:RNA splicing factor n=1 Tax=Lithospermum erythrorhizon TaxID=34254 RepID=A0AAV3NKY4_LITER
MRNSKSRMIDFNLHTLWVAFAKLYENHNDIGNARVIFDKAVQVNYKAVDHLASVWCECGEMELIFILNVDYAVAAEGNEAVQMKIHRSLGLWTLYVDTGIYSQ